MTSSDLACQHLKFAILALRAGRRHEARRWATSAAHLDPKLEEPWLILAAVGSPEASVAYLEKALEINPDSRRARQGLAWAVSRRELSAPPIVPDSGAPAPAPADKGATEPVPVARAAYRLSAHKDRPKSTRPGWQEPFLLSTLAVALVLCLASLFWLILAPSSPAQAWSSSAPRPQGILPKPSLTVTSTPTATATFTPTSTLTATPTPTETPTPLPTDTPEPPTEVPTEEPVVINVPDEVSPASDGRWIDVNLTEQHLYAYEGSQLVNDFIVSTGTWQHPTVTGSYQIYARYLYSDMKGPGYYLPNVPYTQYFYRGYALHGTYWHNNFGVPMSHGCVNLRTEDAAWLYNWSSEGTLVNIHY